MFDDTVTQAAQFETFRRDVLTGLARHPKTIPSRWLYDERGSELFKAITKLDEYYLTRTEVGILRRFGTEIAAFCEDCDVLLEYGAGAGVKSELLLKTLERPSTYVPIDISGEFLERTSARLRAAFPALRVRPLVADFAASFTLPDEIPKGNRVGFFPGSTIGNLNAEESALLLRRLGAQVGPGGRAIVGVDTKKGLEILLPAYDDKEGVTAAFNDNLLLRINRELGADFVGERFRHEVRWNARESAIEMHLRSLVSQTVTVCGCDVRLERGETIHTESSRKYDVSTFSALARASGWRIDRVWSDDHRLFAVYGLVRSQAGAMRSSRAMMAPAVNPSCV